MQLTDAKYVCIQQCLRDKQYIRMLATRQQLPHYHNAHSYNSN